VQKYGTRVPSADVATPRSVTKSSVANRAPGAWRSVVAPDPSSWRQTVPESVKDVVPK
jgi:hypothetical protein